MRVLFKLFWDTPHDTEEVKPKATRGWIKKTFGILIRDAIEELPKVLNYFPDIDLNTIIDESGNGMLSVCSWAWTGQSHCLAYLLDKGLDPFVLDQSEWGPAAVHIAILFLDKPYIKRLMGFAFTDTRFHGFKTRDRTTVETYLSRKSAEEQSAFREIQTIFYIYRGFHDSAETAEEYHDHLIAALHYFLAAEQMKTEVADKEDDPYLKRFHLKKVVNDLRKATGHYYQEIIEREETLPALDEFDRYLALSAEIIDSVEPDHPDIDWEIKLGDEAFFADWRVQLEVLQKWREERRISFSSESSEDGIATRDIKEDEPLLGAGADLRYRFPHR